MGLGGVWSDVVNWSDDAIGETGIDMVAGGFIGGPVGAIAGGLYGALNDGKASTIVAPTPSTTEDKIMQQQLQALNNGEAFNEALMPYIMEALGYKYRRVTKP